MVDELTESNLEVNKIFEQLSRAFTSVGKGIGNQMALMAAAILSWKQPGTKSNFDTSMAT